MTVVSVQGMRFTGDGEAKKTPAKLVGIGPNGKIQWVHQNAEEYDVVWNYDVDPMANGNVFVTAAGSTGTLLYELNPWTQETVWMKRLDLEDTHDADLINGGEEILIANMRNYNQSTGENEDRIVIYNRTTEEIEWEWHFDDHFDQTDLAENYTDDWTHVNDVDKVGDSTYLVSPRNFDQVIVVNRTTNEIDMHLGDDEANDILYEQHNPDYLESKNGMPTFLVADSENNRIVEYVRESGNWNRTWTLTGDLAWPRDGDRLANGNTLITDSNNQRIVEVTPEGNVVWEVYTPWLVYDTARLNQTNESGGPTMADHDVTGIHEIHESKDRHNNEADLESCHEMLENVSGWVNGDALNRTIDTERTSQDVMADNTIDMTMTIIERSSTAD